MPENAAKVTVPGPPPQDCPSGSDIDREMESIAARSERTSECLNALLNRFAEDQRPCEPELEELALGDPPGFQQAVLEYLRKGGKGPAELLLVKLLHHRGLLLELLVDPDGMPLDEAISLAHLSSRNVLLLDVSLAKELAQNSSQQTDRILCLLAEIAESKRILPLLFPLLGVRQKRVRSKAARIFAKLCPSSMHGRLVDQAAVMNSLEDENPRVRANVVEALWGRNWVRSELLVAVKDPHNRVRANAALGLYKLGHRRGLVVLEEMAHHPEDPFRASAAWAMGETGQQDLLPTLEPLSQDPDEMVRRNAVQAIAKIQAAKAERDLLSTQAGDSQAGSREANAHHIRERFSWQAQAVKRAWNKTRR